MVYTLTDKELEMAENAAHECIAISQAAGLQENHGQPLRGAAADEITIEGFCSELAVSRVLHFPWVPSTNSFKGADIASNVQVRSTTGENHRLIVRWGDPVDNIYVLAVGRRPKYRIAGWMHGREAKNHRYWKDVGNGREAAFWVPQHSLHSITELEIVRKDSVTT